MSMIPGRREGVSSGPSGHRSGETVADVGEFGLIADIIDDLPDDGRLTVGPGDDAAAFIGDGDTVITTDVLNEGVHFRTDWSDAQDIGARAVAQNLADVEAMGADVLGVVAAVSVPSDTEAAWVRELGAGMRSECAKAGASLMGGDLSSSDRISIAVTAVGRMRGRAPVRRSGARPGDVVAVKGRLGWAAAGLFVLGRGFKSPRALVAAYRVPDVPYGHGGRAADAGASSMIDISDGLLADLGHIADASGVGFRLRSEAFEVPDALGAVAATTGSNPLRFVLTGGEDHALVATFDPVDVPDDWLIIGRVVAEPGVLVDDAEWDTEEGSGYVHFRN